MTTVTIILLVVTLVIAAFMLGIKFERWKCDPLAVKKDDAYDEYPGEFDGR